MATDQNLAAPLGLRQRGAYRPGQVQFRIVRGHDDRRADLSILHLVIPEFHASTNTSKGQSNIARNSGDIRNPVGSSRIRSVIWER